MDRQLEAREKGFDTVMFLMQPRGEVAAIAFALLCAQYAVGEHTHTHAYSPFLRCFVASRRLAEKRRVMRLAGWTDFCILRVSRQPEDAASSRCVSGGSFILRGERCIVTSRKSVVGSQTHKDTHLTV